MDSSSKPYSFVGNFTVLDVQESEVCHRGPRGQSLGSRGRRSLLGPWEEAVREMVTRGRPSKASIQEFVGGTRRGKIRPRGGPAFFSRPTRVVPLMMSATPHRGLTILDTI